MYPCNLSATSRDQEYSTFSKYISELIEKFFQYTSQVSGFIPLSSISNLLSCLKASVIFYPNILFNSFTRIRFHPNCFNLKLFYTINPSHTHTFCRPITLTVGQAIIKSMTRRMELQPSWVAVLLGGEGEGEGGPCMPTFSKQFDVHFTSDVGRTCLRHVFLLKGTRFWQNETSKWEQLQYIF